MPLKTPEEYVESLRALRIRAYVGGERVDSIVDSPLIAPHINTAAKTYELAHRPEHREVMTAESHLTGERIHRYTHIFQNADDLVGKIQMLRLLGQVYRHVLPALRRPRCAERRLRDLVRGRRGGGHRLPPSASRDYLEMVQREDLMLAGAMTDPKGHRGKRPSEQADPDAFVRVVDAGRTGS